MEIRQLEIFCTVAEKKGFSVAAEALSLTQPTVSFQIASLEEHLGVKLLDRSGKTTTLTKSGEVLYKYARQILELKQEAEQAVHRLKGLFWGEIHLGASTIPGEYILPEILPRFSADHPGLEINLTIGDTKGIIEQILGNKVEIGVVGASFKDDKLNFTEFISDQLVLIAPVNRDWIPGSSIKCEELGNYPFVLREEGSGTLMSFERSYRESGFNFDDIKVSMTMGSTEAVKQAVASGAGVSIISERAIRNEIKLGIIKKVDIAGVELVRDFYITYPKRKVLSPAVEALLQFLVVYKSGIPLPK